MCSTTIWCLFVVVFHPSESISVITWQWDKEQKSRAYTCTYSRNLSLPRPHRHCMDFVLDFDNAVIYSHPGNGLQHCYMLWQWGICTPLTRLINSVPYSTELSPHPFWLMWQHLAGGHCPMWTILYWDWLAMPYIQVSPLRVRVKFNPIYPNSVCGGD